MPNATKTLLNKTVSEGYIMDPGTLDLGREAAERFYKDGLKMWRAGRLDEAHEALDRCLSLDPDHARAYSARAGLNHWLGREPQALEDISKALALRPDHIGDLHNRAVVLASLGRQAEAILEYESVLIRDPSSAGTLNNLAWLLATARDPALRDCRKAIDYSRRAVAAIRSAAWLDTLATAHAECGDFESAVKIETEALNLSQPPNPAYKKRLELYRRGISYTSWITIQ
jgi:tetratricopeptide (TPR) repeat protein